MTGKISFIVELETNHQPFTPGLTQSQKIDLLIQETRIARGKFVFWLNKHDSCAVVMPCDSLKCITPVLFVKTTNPCILEMLQSKDKPDCVRAIEQYPGNPELL